MHKIPLPIILLCLLLGVYHWRKDKGMPKAIESIANVSPGTAVAALRNSISTDKYTK